MTNVIQYNDYVREKRRQQASELDVGLSEFDFLLQMMQEPTTEPAEIIEVDFDMGIQIATRPEYRSEVEQALGYDVGTNVTFNDDY